MAEAEKQVHDVVAEEKAAQAAAKPNPEPNFRTQ
jgi:hypothetical protein